MRHTKYTDIRPFDFNGLQIADLTPGALNVASVAEITVPAGVRHGRARSTKCDKIYVCIEGELSFEVEDVCTKLVPTDTLFIRKNECFDYHNSSDYLAKLLLIHIPPFDLECEQFLGEDDRTS